jgi:hypothetical protein
VRENVLLNEINQKLDEARNLAIETGGFTLFYLIEMAFLEAAEMSTQSSLGRRWQIARSGTLAFKASRQRTGAVNRRSLHHHEARARGRSSSRRAAGLCM